MITSQEQLLVRSTVKSVVVLLPPSEIDDSECLEVSQLLYSKLNQSPIFFLNSPALAAGSSSLGEDKNLPLELSLVFNLFCNSPINATCCIPSQRSYVNSLVTPLLLIILAVLLGIWLVFASGATFALAPHLEALSFDIKRFLIVVNSIGSLTAVLFFMLLADRLDFFTKVAVQSSPLLFAILLGAIILCAVLTVVPSENSEFMSHQLVLEFRGFVILLVIAINYTAVDEVFPAARLREVSIGAILFLTGYSYFMSAWVSGDFSWMRMCKKLFKLNLIPVCVCLTMGSPYGAYYLVPLTTAWFLLTFAFVSLWLVLLHNTQKDALMSQVAMGVLFLSAFILLSFLPVLKGLFVDTLSLPFVRSVVQSFDEDPDEIFRVFCSQRYMPLCGMLLAYIIANQQKRLAHYSVQLKVIVVLLTSIALLVYYFIVVSQRAYNLESILDVIPVLCLLLLRSMTDKLRGVHSRFLLTAGSLYMWLFVSHYHILMALNGKGLFVLIPRFYYLNLIAVGIVYLFVSEIVRISTGTLNKLFW